MTQITFSPYFNHILTHPETKTRFSQKKNVPPLPRPSGKEALQNFFRKNIYATQEPVKAHLLFKTDSLDKKYSSNIRKYEVNVCF
jgi:hypothetical protein